MPLGRGASNFKKEGDAREIPMYREAPKPPPPPVDQEWKVLYKLKEEPTFGKFEVHPDEETAKARKETLEAEGYMVELRPVPKVVKK
jgi:hypothetical protein